MGTVDVADTGGNQVEEFSAARTLFATCTHSSLPGSGGTLNPLSKPQGVALDGTGNLYIEDTGDGEVVGPTGTHRSS